MTDFDLWLKRNMLSQITKIITNTCQQMYADAYIHSRKPIRSTIFSKRLIKNMLFITSPKSQITYNNKCYNLLQIINSTSILGNTKELYKSIPPLRQSLEK